MRERRWLFILLVGGALTLTYFALPRGGVAQSGVFQLVSGACVLGILAGVRQHDPRPARPWFLLAAGVGLWFLGDLMVAAYELTVGSAIPFPSVADLVYLLAYPLIGMGVWRLGPTIPKGRRGELLDVLIVWLSLGLVVWLGLGDTSPGGFDLGRVFAVGYPLMDVLLIGALARMVLVRGARSPSQLLLLGGMVSVLLADVVFGTLSVSGGYMSGDPIDAAWLLGYVLMAAAGLHPSMRALGRNRGAEGILTAGRRGHLAALGFAALTPVVVLGLVATESLHLARVETIALIAVSVLGVALLVVRMSGFIRLAQRSSTALVDSEERHRSILENSLAGIATTGPDLELNYANPGFAHMFGYQSPAALVRDMSGRRNHLFANPEEGEALVQRVLAGPAAPFEAQFRRRDGSTFWGQCSVRVVPDEQGGIRQLIAMLLDVSAQKEAEEAVRQTERMAGETMDSLSAQIAILDGRGVILAANQVWRELAPQSEDFEAPEGTDYLDVCRRAEAAGDAEAAALRVAIEDVLAGERETVSLEHSRRTSDGIRWFVVHVTRFRGQGLPAVVVAHEDVTERREAEDRYADIFENVAEGIYRTAADGTILVANPALARMFGYESPDALLAAGVRTQDHYVDAALRDRMVAATERDEMRDYEMPMRRRDGSVFWWSLNARAVRDDDGRVVGYTGTASEITERRRAEERARRQNQHLRLLQAGATAANEAASPEEAMQSVLTEVGTLLGWQLGHAYVRDDAMGPLTSSGIWHDEDPAQFDAFREVTRHALLGAGVGLAGRVLARGLPEWTMDIDEDSLFTRAPVARSVGVQTAFAVPVRMGREVVAVLELFSTRRIPQDDELMRVMAHIGTQLGRVVERSRGEQTLRDAYEREREAGRRLLALDEMKNNILTAVSHELRTPLTAVYGFAELLESQGSRMSPEETTMVTGRLAENARKLERLLSDLLEVDRLTRGIVEPRLEPMDLSLLAHRVVRESGAFETGRVNLHAEPVTVPVDRPKVERIVENLVSNALRYSPPGTPVDVEVGPVEGGGTISVEDRGPGVPEDLRTAIFEPFRQGPNAVSHSPGVGIGLSLVAQFATLHGGRAWVEDRSGGGARFVVFLPDGLNQADGPVPEISERAGIPQA